MICGCMDTIDMMDREGLDVLDMMDGMQREHRDT